MNGEEKDKVRLDEFRRGGGKLGVWGKKRKAHLGMNQFILMKTD